MKFINKSGGRPVAQLLAEKSGAGSGIAEGLGGIALIMIAIMALAMGVTSDMNAVQGISVKAERQTYLSNLVADKRGGSTWGTASAPTTEKKVLPNGRTVDVTMWRDVTPTGTSLTAVAATSQGADAANCTGPTAVQKKGCVYATRFHANGLDGVEPQSIVRKDPSTTSAPVGTVDPRVSTADSIPQGATIASASDHVATVWRYLINAQSLEASGEIQISQAGKLLALIPVDAKASNYFGTFSVTLDVPVTVTVTQGNVVVQTIYIYRTGGTA
ncbi:hypothetical protein SAMN06295974_3737 [Plantibacter flavus]|uniref:Uncharacterized protein n=1 Tax=Plantibacter flavus TaxID=150123 RepID=A0A3N2BLG6_9MICO|nr:hypothetical protein [Plantibacter flavus]ROR76115.1 hypothetical protein EDD42_4068 [Plantibacter flavus]SMG48442.1 hypothetical protein SAMN06295974_3737 [Plantibacter flavus]